MDDMNKREVLRFLLAIEEGGLPLDDCYQMLEKMDPLLAHFLLRYLREKFPAKGSATGAADRLLQLLQHHPDAAKLAAPPRDEPMIEWFDDTHSMGEFFGEPRQFVDTIVDKLEG